MHHGRRQASSQIWAPGFTHLSILAGALRSSSTTVSRGRPVRRGGSVQRCPSPISIDDKPNQKCRCSHRAEEKERPCRTSGCGGNDDSTDGDEDHDVPTERCSSHSDAGLTFVWPGTEQRSNVAISTAEQVVPASTDDRHKFDGEGGPPTGANPGTEGNRGTESNCDRWCHEPRILRRNHLRTSWDASNISSTVESKNRAI